MGTDAVQQERVGARRAFYRPEFVVAAKHVDEVSRTLGTLGVGHEVVDRSRDLGLGLFRLADDEAAADLVVAAARELAAGHPSVAGPSRSATSLDRFLHGLRWYFAERYAGWSPMVGKNRLVGQVIGGGKISHGGGSDPEVTDLRPPDRATLGAAEARRGLGVRVGVLDTSVSARGSLSGGWVAPAADVLTPAEKYAVAAGHATFVTGLVLTQAPAAVVEARRVLSNESGDADSWAVAKAIAEVGKTRPDVLNLSFTCYTEDGGPPMVLAAAIERLDPQTVVVAAAGNHGDVELGADPETSQEVDEDDRRKPAWPAALDSVVAVGAADRHGTPAEFSPKDAQWVDVLAPGVDTVSTFLEGRVRLAGHRGAPVDRDFDGFASWSGTSFAAALVSGAIAAGTVPGEVSARQSWDRLLERTTSAHRFLSL
jgi:membrane-anchored mycosin MYCP